MTSTDVLLEQSLTIVDAKFEQFPTSRDTVLELYLRWEMM